MTAAFCPGHITCFFAPAGGTGEDILSKGSLGAGIRITLGADVEVTERSDTKTIVTIDGAVSEAPVTRSVLSQMAPGRGFDVTVMNGLPCGEGFGISAAGAIAAAFCLAEAFERPPKDAFEAAHRAEIYGGGGLGDVSALYCLEHQPVRIKAGLPPRGTVIGTGVSFPHLTLAVLGPKMNTGSVLSDPARRAAIVSAGKDAVEEYLKAPSKEALYRISNRFSAGSGIEHTAVSEAIAALGERGYGAGMCMLGNSIFTDAPSDIVEEVCPGADVFGCASTDAPAFIRKA